MVDYEKLPEHITVKYFTTQLLGVSREWYYKHEDDADIPKRVFIAGKAMLVTRECLAYIENLKAERNAKPTAPKPLVKRGPGRPKKVSINPPS